MKAFLGILWQKVVAFCQKWMSHSSCVGKPHSPKEAQYARCLKRISIIHRTRAFSFQLFICHLFVALTFRQSKMPGKKWLTYNSRSLFPTLNEHLFHLCLLHHYSTCDHSFPDWMRLVSSDTEFFLFLFLGILAIVNYCERPIVNWQTRPVEKEIFGVELNLTYLLSNRLAVLIGPSMLSNKWQSPL